MDPVNADWTEFHDSRLLVRAPAYLRQQRSMMSFRAPKKRRSGQNIIMFSVLILDNASQIDAVRNEIEEFNPLVAQEGTERILVRQGRTDWLDGGLELLVDMRILSTGYVNHDLTVLFQRSNVTLYVMVFGDGDLTAFDGEARAIVQSIRPVGGGEARVEQTRGRTGGLKRADKARLSVALMELPPELAYLRKPIQAFAREDQESLLAGDADLEPLMEALRQHPEKANFAAVANRDADALRGWLKSQPDHDGAWAAPVSFVEGALRGTSMFADEI